MSTRGSERDSRKVKSSWSGASEQPDRSTKDLTFYEPDLAPLCEVLFSWLAGVAFGEEVGVRTFTVKNWSKFQQYKDRRPQWIKLHRDIFEDFKFQKLECRTQRDLMMIWLLFSQQDLDDLGMPLELPYDPEEIAFRIRSDEPVDLDAMAAAGFIVPRSTESHGSVPSDPPPVRKSTEAYKSVKIPSVSLISDLFLKGVLEYTEISCESQIRGASPIADLPSNDSGESSSEAKPDRFDEFWRLYPRREKKQYAHQQWLKLTEEERDAALADIPQRIQANWRDREIEHVPHASTYINQKIWTDDLQNLALPMTTEGARAAPQMSKREQFFITALEEARAEDDKRRNSPNHGGGGGELAAVQARRAGAGVVVRSDGADPVRQGAGSGQGLRIVGPREPPDSGDGVPRSAEDYGSGDSLETTCGLAQANGARA